MGINSYRNKVRFISLIIALVLLWYLGRYIRLDREAIRRSLAGIPILYSAAIFIFLYVIVTFFVWLAKDALRIVSAFLYGALLSTLLIWLAEIINAFILFFLARNLGRSFIDKSLPVRYNKLDDKLANLNFPWLFIFRVVPLIPFRFMDLAAGLTRLSFKRYIAAVVLGSPLRIFWVQYVLAGAGENIFKEPEALTGYFTGNKALFFFSLAYLVLAVIVARKLKE